MMKENTFYGDIRFCLSKYGLASKASGDCQEGVDPEKPEFATNQITGRMMDERVSKGYEDGAESA